jgi:hypothetical protein
MREFPQPRKRGAQPGNRNAAKTGLRTKAMRDFKRALRLRLREIEAAVAMAREITVSGT